MTRKPKAKPDDAQYETLTDAMEAGDALAEAVKRYRMLDEAFQKAAPREKKSLSVELGSLMDKIVHLRANRPSVPSVVALSGDEAKFGKIVPLDDRFNRAD